MSSSPCTVLSAIDCIILFMRSMEIIQVILIVFLVVGSNCINYDQ